jgi:hypothetical protein
MDSETLTQVFSKLLAHFDDPNSIFQRSPDRTEAMISALVSAMRELIDVHKKTVYLTPEKFPENTNESLDVLSDRLSHFEACLHDYFLLPHVYAPLGETTIVEKRSLNVIQDLLREQVMVARESEQLLSRLRDHTQSCNDLLERELGNNLFINR